MLYVILEKTAHGVHMPKGSYKELDQAFEWIQSFWLTRLEEETKILGHQPVERKVQL